MNLYELSHEVRKLYSEIEIAFSSFQKKSNLPCLPGCGECCLFPGVEAHPIEMIPMAIELHQKSLAEETLAKLQENLPTTCVVYQRTSPDGTQGRCGMYSSRPVVCRIFGVSGYLNKQNKTELSICKKIKTQHPNFTASDTLLSEAPLIKEWALKLSTIHPDLLQAKLPINQALKIALEKVLVWSQFQEKI